MLKSTFSGYAVANNMGLSSFV